MKTYVGRFRSRQAHSVEDAPEAHAKASIAPAPYLAGASDDELPDSVFDGTGGTSQPDVWGWDKRSGDEGQDDKSQVSSEGLLRGRQSSEDAEGVEDDGGDRMEEGKESSASEAFDDTRSVGGDDCIEESRPRVRRSWEESSTYSDASGTEESHADARHITGLASVLQQDDGMQVDAEDGGEQESAAGPRSADTLPTQVQQEGALLGGFRRDEGNEDVSTVPMAMGELLTAVERPVEHDDQPQRASATAHDPSEQDAREALVRRILAGEASDDEEEDDDDDDGSRKAAPRQLQQPQKQQLQSPEASGPSFPQQPARALMDDGPPLPQQSPHAESMDVAESSTEAPPDPASPQRPAHAADLYASASEAAADHAAEDARLGSPASISPHMSAQSPDKGRGRKERRRLVIDADDDSDSGNESLTRKPKGHKTEKAAKLGKGGRKVKGMKVEKGKGRRGRKHRKDVEAQPDQEGTRAQGSEGMASHSDASSARSVVKNADAAPSMQKKRRGRIKKADAPASPDSDLEGIDAVPDSVTDAATGEGDLTSLALKELGGSGDLSLFDTDDEGKGDVKEMQASSDLMQKKRGGTGDSEYEKSDSEDSVVSSMASGDEEVARQAALTKEEKKLLAQQAIKNEELEDSRKMEEQAKVQQQIREAMFKHQQEQSEKSKELQAMLLNKIRARHQATDDTYFQQLTDELRSLIKQTKNEKRVEEGAKPLEESSSDGGESQGDDSGDDDLELEVVPQKALAVPDTAVAPPDFRKGSFIESLSRRRKLTAASSSSGVFAVSKVLRANPNDPLAALKNKLHQAARQQSAKWLARELGWKDHVQHQRDLKIKELQRKAVAHRLKAMREQKDAGLDLDGLVPPQDDDELGHISGLDSESDSDSSLDSVESDVDSDADDEEALAEVAMGERHEMETAGSDGDVEDNEDDDDVGDGPDAAAMELSTEMPCDSAPVPQANDDTMTEAEKHGSFPCVAAAFSLGGSGDDTPPTELESMASEESDPLARELSVSRTASGASQALGSRSQSHLGRPSQSSSPGKETAAQLGDAREQSINCVSRGGAETPAEGLILAMLCTQDESPAPMADGAADSPAEHATGAPTTLRKLQLADDGSLKPAPQQKGLGAYFAAKAAEEGASCSQSSVDQPPKQPTVPKKGTIMAAFQKQADKAAEEQETPDGEEGVAGETETQPLEGDAEAGSDQEEEAEEEDEEPGPPVDRAAAYKAMLEAERKQIKAHKRMKKLGIADQEAEEEEEEEMVRGLEDFGFGAISGIAGGKGKDAEEYEHVKVREDDFENIVDQLSDGEGDEKALEEWARNDELKRDQDHLDEVGRRVREGHQGRRGRGVGARGHLRLDELVGQGRERRDEAYRLGLLPPEEMMEYQLEKEKEDKVKEVDFEEELVKGINERHRGFRAESAMLFMSSSDEEGDEEEHEVATGTIDVGKQQEREERAVEKAWVRKAKMRRVLADLEDREAAGLSAPGSSKLPTLFRNANDNDSQHIMGLLQRSASIIEVASRKRKEKELEFSADIIDHHSGLDHDSTAQMGFPSKRRAVSNESQASGSSCPIPPPSTSAQGLVSRIRELKRSSTLTSSGSIMQQGLYRKGSMLTGMKQHGSFTSSSSSLSGGAMHVAHVTSHKFVFTSTAAPTGLNEDSQSRFSGSMPLGTDASMHGGSHSLMGSGQNSQSQSQSCFAPSVSSHAGNGGSRKRANSNTALWKGLSQRRF